MSYQVNFRLFVPGCSFQEAEKLASLQQELQQTFERMVRAAVVEQKSAGCSPAEVVFLK